jgi:hypothetical protein
MIEITDEMVEMVDFRLDESVDECTTKGRRCPPERPCFCQIRAALTAVAPLIAAAEREACARVAEGNWTGMPFGPNDEAAMDAADAIAAAIRARGGEA